MRFQGDVQGHFNKSLIHHCCGLTTTAAQHCAAKLPQPHQNNSSMGCSEDAGTDGFTNWLS